MSKSQRICLIMRHYFQSAVSQIQSAYLIERMFKSMKLHTTFSLLPCRVHAVRSQGAVTQSTANGSWSLLSRVDHTVPQAWPLDVSNMFACRLPPCLSSLTKSLTKQQPHRLVSKALTLANISKILDRWGGRLEAYFGQKALGLTSSLPQKHGHKNTS